MKVLVPVKEVATVDDEFEISGTEIDERFLGADLNEWDEYALEEAVQLSEDGLADEVVTVTIGPEDAEQTIRQALAKGADRAVRVWDDALEDVDLLDVGELLDAALEFAVDRRHAGVGVDLEVVDDGRPLDAQFRGQRHARRPEAVVAGLDARQHEVGLFLGDDRLEDRRLRADVE